MGEMKWQSPGFTLSLSTDQPVMQTHWYQPHHETVSCLADDDHSCPYCDIGLPVKKKMAVTVFDKGAGKSSVMLLNEDEYHKLFEIKPAPWWKRTWWWLLSLLRCKR